MLRPTGELPKYFGTFGNQMILRLLHQSTRIFLKTKLKFLFTMNAYGVNYIVVHIHRGSFHFISLSTSNIQIKMSYEMFDGLIFRGGEERCSDIFLFDLFFGGKFSVW